MWALLASHFASIAMDAKKRWIKNLLVALGRGCCRKYLLFRERGKGYVAGVGGAKCKGVQGVNVSGTTDLKRPVPVSWVDALCRTTRSHSHLAQMEGRLEVIENPSRWKAARLRHATAPAYSDRGSEIPMTTILKIARPRSGTQTQLAEPNPAEMWDQRAVGNALIREQLLAAALPLRAKASGLAATRLEKL